MLEPDPTAPALERRITVTELMLATKEVIAPTFRPLPLYVAAAGVYWVLSLCFEALQRRAESKLNQPHH